MAKKREFKPDKPYSGFLQKLILTRQQRKSVLKWSLYALVLILLSVVQDVLLSRFRILGATTELVPCGIFLICLLEGIERGSVFALIASLLYLFSGTAAGVYSMVFLTALAIFATAVRQSYLQSGFPAAMLCTGVALVLYEMLVFLIGVFLEKALFSQVVSPLVTTGLTMIAAPLIYWIVHAISGGGSWKE